MYEFNEQHAYDFARHVNAETKLQGGELFFKICPYCKPKATKDNVRSFSINLKTGQFKCFRASCGVTGNMVTLSKDFDFSLGQQVDEYYRPQKQYKRLKQFEEPIVPKSAAVTYLKNRGISEEVAKRYEITTQTNNDNILVFPFFDEKGILQFVKYRKTDYDKEKDSCKEWCEANCKPILFGMKQCEDFTRLIITEGMLDSLSVATAGIKNAVSVPTGAKGFTWIPYCWDWINQFEEIVVFGDYEKGKITLLEELSQRLKPTIKHVREEDYKDCKDANEILLKYGAEQVVKCVENAIIVPIKCIVDLADVPDLNPYDIPKLKTGISQIDRLLCGGLPMCGVTIVSGKNGEGKSVLTSQILVNAIEQGYKCFTYSGELPNHLFKAWMDYQIAGPSHIIQYDTQWGEIGYNISKSNKALINDWYRGKCFLYDHMALDGEETESLIEIVENVIMQYGVKVVLLDNLMTAIDLEATKGSDTYERQSCFVKKLSRVALKHNALVILVAHKRKNNISTNENDEIAGSGDISNLATIVISYGKDKDLAPGQRRCKVSKNRLFGKTCIEGYALDYEEKSKRIYGTGDDVQREYGWNRDVNGFSPDDEETPFD